MKNLLCLLLLVPFTEACGPQERIKVIKKERAAPQVSAAAWDEIKPIVDQYCNNCHGKSVGQAFTKANFGEGAIARVANGTMPPGGGLPKDIKSKLESYK